MLKFDRKEFKSGVIIVKEIYKDEQGKDTEKGYTFRPKDKGKMFDFKNEAYILEHYPMMFSKG